MRSPTSSSLPLSLALGALAAIGAWLAPTLARPPSPPAAVNEAPVDPASCAPSPGWFLVDGTGPLLHLRRLVETFPEGALEGIDPYTLDPAYRARAGALEVVDAFVRSREGRCEVLAVEPLGRAATLDELVHAVGRWHEDEPLLVYHLARTPHRSVRALVDQLDPLEPGPVDYTEGYRMARIVVALEAITGRSFAFYPAALDAEAEACFSRGFPAGYWGYRMSWAKLCLAPYFERLRVVNAWRDWLRAEGETFAPVPLEEIAPPMLP